jgi:hypothetical protein
VARRPVPEIEYRKIRIRVYRSNGRFSAQFAKENGGRYRLERGSEREAFEAAKDLIDEMRDPERRAQRLDRETAEQLMAEHKIPVTVAVQDYARRVLSITKPLTVAACAEQYLKKQERDTGSKNYKDLVHRINRFASVFAEKMMQDVSVADINSYLDSIPRTKRTRRNHRDCLVTFFRYAQAYGSLSLHEKTVAELSIRPKAETPKRGVLTPHEGASMFEVAREIKSPALPGLLCLAFGGSRHEEISPMDPTEDRLQWRHVLWKSRKIYTPSEVSKLAEDRYGPLLPNVLEWLKPYRKARGPIYEGTRFDLEIAKIAQLAGVRYPHNGLRHSFITYRILVTGNPAQVADEAGNSIATIEKHYRKRGIEKSTALAWFRIVPKALAKKKRPRSARRAT